MNLILVELIALIIVLILLLIVRVIRLRKNGRMEPISQSEQEIQYQLLMQEIQSLEEACNHGNVSRKLRNKLALKQAQADKLQTLMTKSMIPDVPDTYQPERKTKAGSLLKTKPVNPKNIYLCPKCRKQVQGDDKFCANCGYRLQTKRRI